MTKYIILFFCSCIALSEVDAQDLRSYVISSYGASLMGSEGSMYVTVGESLNTEIEEDGNMIAQGFLQVTLIGKTVATEETIDFDLEVYPNPVDQYLNIELLELPTSPTKYLLLDQLGRLVSSATLTELSTTIDFQDVTIGSYFLQLQSANRKSKVVKVQKLNQ